MLAARKGQKNVILIADNIQITNRAVAEALSEMRPQAIQELAKQCEAAGADMLDINSGPLSRDTENKMRFLVESVQEVSDLPLLIDTANPKAMAAGLRANRKTVIINGFSLEPAKIEAILPLAKEFDADMIAYLLYPDSRVPSDSTQRLNIAVEICNEIRKSGIDSNRLIIDPVIVPLMWENGTAQASEVLSVIRMLPDVLGFPVRTVAGLSNLTSGKGNREKKLIAEQAYLPMLAASGLTMALLNIFHHETVRTARVCSLLMRHSLSQTAAIFTWEEI